jgi:choline-sulfatase
MLAAGSVGLAAYAGTRAMASGRGSEVQLPTNTLPNAMGSEVQLPPNGLKRRPNILFLMTDQHRADCLGCDGNRIIKTPNFDRLAREGAYFSQAYSSTPTCIPARAALLTGKSPWHHGMIGYGTVAERYPFEMPRALNDSGYYTFAIGKLHYTPQRNYHGFQGALLDESGRAWTPDFISDYRKWFKEKAPDLNPDATGIGWNDYRAGVYALPEELHPTRWTGDTAVDFIEKYHRDEPFMLKVSFARPHSPYDPPRRFMEMYDEDDMPAPHIGEWASRFAEGGDPKHYALWHGDLGIKQVRKSRRGYYGSVSFIDEQIGRVLTALEKRGLLENTLILFTVDHGDMLGDHHHWRKSYPYEGSARVPMLVRWPESMGIEARRGQKIEEVVELRDVLPTFLDAADAKIPSDLDGQSLLRLVRGETSGWRPYLDLEHDICYDKTNNWNALTDGRWKYIFNVFDGSQELFDLRNDPGEIENLASDPAYARTIKMWRQRLIKHLSERDERFVANGEPVLRSERVMYSTHYPGKPPRRGGE